MEPPKHHWVEPQNKKKKRKLSEYFFLCSYKFYSTFNLPTPLTRLLPYLHCPSTLGSPLRGPSFQKRLGLGFCVRGKGLRSTYRREGTNTSSRGWDRIGTGAGLADPCYRTMAQGP